MANLWRSAVVLVVAIAALMLVPSAALAPATAAHLGGSVAAPLAALPDAASVATASAPASSVHAAANAGATESRVVSTLKSDGVPMSHVFLPNFNAHVSTAGGVISPLYAESPAPMGLGDFGIQDVNGVNVGTETYTSSVEGAATLNSVDPLYVTSSAPDEFTIQLNTVLTNVDLFGNTSYNFWIQNVPFYSADSGILSFENNIWNFSNPSFYFDPNGIFSGNGVVYGDEVYIAGGPSFYVPTPFTVAVYNNATVLNDRPTLFFNYTVTTPGGSISGSYDEVVFNSVAGTPTAPAPAPTFQINGQTTNPTGFLLNDAEIMLGGPGGGSTTTLFNIAGSMGLWILPNGTSTYEVVPAAFDFGTDTGETSEGIAEASTTGSNPMAVLGPGPSLLYPLWGVAGAHPGSEKITVHLYPSNAFVFASVGNGFDANTAAWAPTPVSGPATFVLAPQDYSFEFLLSDHNPVTVVVPLTHASHNLGIGLSINRALGDYTPLWAESNSQLAAISTGGAGTVTSPYVLDNQPAVVSPLFGELNDYLFPVFPGIYLIDTSAYVSIVHEPAFGLTYSLASSNLAGLTNTGSPVTNDLNLELYDASHVSIVGSADLSGWFSSYVYFSDPASIYLWNSTDDLVAGNTFAVESNGITASGGGGNVIWGNVFVGTTVSAPNPASVLNNGASIALSWFEGNDLIYNNAFLTPYTATLFPENFYNGVFEPFVDRWNVSVQPASSVHIVNGWALSGSILGLSWIGGNYWDNYGTPEDPYGVLPYNDGGLIWTGGDYHPLLPFALEQVKFREAGLPSGTPWSVDLDGYTQTTTGTSLTFWEPAGSYSFSVTVASGFFAHPASGTLTVSTSWVYKWINFT